MQIHRTERYEENEFIQAFTARFPQYLAVAGGSLHQENIRFPDVLILRRDMIEVTPDSLDWTDPRAVVAVVEGKSQDHHVTRRDQYIGQLLEYMERLMVPIGFLTNYSTRTLVHQRVPFQTVLRDTGGADAVLDLFAEICLNQASPNLITTRRDIVLCLEEAMRELERYFKKFDIAQINEILAINKQKAEYYISEDEDGSGRCRGSAFVALSQLLFYVILRHARVVEGMNQTPSLADLRQSQGVPSQIQEMLNQVKSINYRAIYRYPLFSKLDDQTSQWLYHIVEELVGMEAVFQEHTDVLGDIFQNLIPDDLRERLAAYYTRALPAKLIAGLTITEPDVTVLDPACGSGTLLVEAYRRKKQLSEHFTHRTCISQIIGNDISVFATILATLNLAIQNPLKWTQNIAIWTGNAFDIPTERFSDLDNYIPRTFTRQSPEEATNEQTLDLSNIRTVLANPPFTRLRHLDPAERERLQQLSEQHYNISIARVANLYSAFLELAPILLSPEEGGRIGLVYPDPGFTVDYMQEIWHAVLLQKNLGIRYICIPLGSDESYSHSADDEIIIVLERGYHGIGQIFHFTEKLRNVEDFDALIESILAGEEHSAYELVQHSQDWFMQALPREWLFKRETLFLQTSAAFVDSTQYTATLGSSYARPAAVWNIPNKYWEVVDVNAAHTEMILGPTEKCRDLFAEDEDDIPETLRIPISPDYPTEPDELEPVVYVSFPRTLKQITECAPLFAPEGHGYLIYVPEESDHPYARFARKIKATVKTWQPPRDIQTRIGIPSQFNLTATKSCVYCSTRPVAPTNLCRTFFEISQWDDLLLAYFTSTHFLYQVILKRKKKASYYCTISPTLFADQFVLPDFSTISREMREKLITASQHWNSLANGKLGSGRSSGRPRFIEQVQQAKADPESDLAQLDRLWADAIGWQDDPVLAQLYEDPLNAMYDRVIELLSIFS